MIKISSCNYKESKIVRDHFDNPIVSRLVYECVYNAMYDWNIESIENDVDEKSEHKFFDINFYVDGQDRNDVSLNLSIYIPIDKKSPTYYEITFSYIENYADVSINPFKNKLYTHSLDIVLGCLNVIATKVNKSRKL